MVHVQSLENVNVTPKLLMLMTRAMRVFALPMLYLGLCFNKLDSLGRSTNPFFCKVASEMALITDIPSW